MASDNIRGSLPTEIGMALKLEELVLNDHSFGIDYKSKEEAFVLSLGR